MAEARTSEQLRKDGQSEFVSGAGDAERRARVTGETLAAKRDDPEGYHPWHGTDVLPSNLDCLKVLRDQVSGRIEYDRKREGGDPEKTTFELRSVAASEWARTGNNPEFGKNMTRWGSFEFQANSQYFSPEHLEMANSALSAAGATDAELLDPKSDDRRKKNEKLVLSLEMAINSPKLVTLGNDGSVRPNANGPAFTGLFEAGSKEGQKRPDCTIEAAEKWMKGIPNLGLNSFLREKGQIEKLEAGAGDKTIADLLKSSNPEIVTLARANGQKQYMDKLTGMGVEQEFGSTGRTGVAAGGILNVKAKWFLEHLNERITAAEAGQDNAPAVSVNQYTGQPSPTTKSGNNPVDLGYIKGDRVAYLRPKANPADRSRFADAPEIGAAPSR